MVKATRASRDPDAFLPAHPASLLPFAPQSVENYLTSQAFLTAISNATGFQVSAPYRMWSFIDDKCFFVAY